MKSRAIVAALIILVLTLAVNSLSALRGGQHQSARPPKAQQADDEHPLAVVDYSDKSHEKDAKRLAKGKRYDNQSSEPIREASYPYQRTWTTHWWQGLPAIPAAQSDVVLLGEVTDAQAYLSNDKTGIYSEFTVRVGEVLKNRGGAPLHPGGDITAERFGGAVRFPSGAIQRYVVRNQRMPRVGREYVFFLKSINEDLGFSLVTGYELRDRRVAPLDGASAEGGEKLPFDNYKGADASSFLKAVRDAVAQAAEISGGR